MLAGAEVAKDTNVVGGVYTDGGLYFGAGKTLDAASFFSGLIDDVRIYNRAVTPSMLLQFESTLETGSKLQV